MTASGYYKAKSLEDALRKLREDPGNVILGGAQWLKKTGGTHKTLIDLSDLSLSYVKEVGDAVEVGALTSQRDFEIHPLIRNIAHGILCDAVSQIMGVPFRNLATIGGSIVGKYPFSDILTPLVALDVSLTFYPARTISLRDYLKESGRRPEILVSLTIKKTEARSFFKKVKATSLDLAILNIAVLKGDQYVIAVGARPLTGALALKAMEYVNGIDEPTDEDFKKAGEIAADELAYFTTTAGSEEYRKLLASTYVYRGLREVSGK